MSAWRRGVAGSNRWDEVEAPSPLRLWGRWQAAYRPKSRMFSVRSRADTGRWSSTATRQAEREWRNTYSRSVAGRDSDHALAQ